MDNIREIIKISKLKKLEWQEHDIEITHHTIGGGIYRFYDYSGEIIYVGKSNNIHRRLHQHFGKDTNTAYFISEVERVEVHIENNPIMQTMLEGIFIAHHTPRYNDEVKDFRRDAENNGLS